MPDIKLERRARSMLLTKVIPVEKMEIVRSLLNNSKLGADEKYSAVIDIIKNCPDKKVTLPDIPKRVQVKAVKKTTGSKIAEVKKEYDPNAPIYTSVNVDFIYNKYRSLKLFKKKYLIYANNRFHLGIKKRLVPSKYMYRVIQDVVSYQEKILSRLPEIMNMIIEDPECNDPLLFNYVRHLSNFLTKVPLVTNDYDRMRWLDQNAFEVEFRDYVTGYISLSLIDKETTENVILLIETKLRSMNDFAKYEIKSDEDYAVRNEKEKSNFRKEKQVYDYIMALRSFLTGGNHLQGAVSEMLKRNHGIDSLLNLLLIIKEGLVFKHDITLTTLVEYYSIKPPVISPDEWNYSKEALKRAGKDPESRRRRHIERIKEELEPYEDIYSLLKSKYEGGNLLMRAFDDQWRLVKRKRTDYGNIYEENFFTFIDECLSYFLNVFTQFIDGREIALTGDKGRKIEARIFFQGYFEKEISLLTDIAREINIYRTNNPNMTISRAEAKRITDGQLRSMMHIERFLRQIGDAFYTIASAMHKHHMLHNRWLEKRDIEEEGNLVFEPIKSESFTDEEREKGKPIPYYDYAIGPFEKRDILLAAYSGTRVAGEIPGDSLYRVILSFCFQLAWECFDRSIISDVDYRKELKNKIKEISR